MGTGERYAIVGWDGRRQAKLLERVLKYLKRGDLFGGFQPSAGQRVTVSLVRDSQRKAVFVIPQLEIAFEIRTPQRIGAITWLSGVPLA